MFITSLVLLFLLRVRFSGNKSIGSIVFSRYGPETHQIFRSMEKNSRKLNKNKCDLEFLHTCAAYNVIPKFLRIKLYRRNLENGEKHQEYLRYRLEAEINCKKRFIQRLQIALEDDKHSLKGRVSWLDFACLNLSNSRRQNNIDVKTRSIHDRKLFNLGICAIRHLVNPDLVIKNFSDRELSKDEINVLMLGLDFGVPIDRINYFTYFLCFEKLAKQLKDQTIYAKNELSIDTFFTRCKMIAHKYFDNFRPEINPLFSKKSKKILAGLGKDSSIRITSPDKGKGIVVLNAQDYINKLNVVVSDQSKFAVCTEKDDKLIQRLELKLNTFLRKMKAKKFISETQYRHLYASGSDVGALLTIWTG